MTDPTERSAAYYTALFVGGLLVVILVPLGLFLFYLSAPMNVSRICTTTDGEVFRLLAFGPDADPYLSDAPVLIDGERGERARASIADCGKPMVIGADFPDVPTPESVKNDATPLSARR
ncbi:MAG: hypothetical protein AAFQ90_10210 [Pseudomonadota bacterium]